MPDNHKQPKKDDAVLGGKSPPPVEGAVLGGIEGVKRRLWNPVVEVRRVSPTYKNSRSLARLGRDVKVSGNR